MSNIVIKSTIWYTASNLMTKAIGFIVIPIYTRIITQSDFGVYNNFLSWLTVMNIVVTICLEATLINAKKDYPHDLRNYTFNMILLSQLSAIVWLLVANCSMGVFQKITDMDALYVNCMFVYLLFIPAVNLVQTWERFLYRYKATVAIALLLSFGIAVVSVLLGILASDHLTGIIVGRTLPVIFLGGTIVAWFLLKGVKLKVEYWRYALPIAWPFVPHLLAMALLGSMNKMFIIQICGSVDNALYSLAYSCGLVVGLFVTSLNSAFSPWLGDRLTSKEYKKIRHISRPYVALFGVIALMVSLVAPEILQIMGGESYLPAKYVMPPIAIGCVFQFIYCMYVNVEQYEKKTKSMALASLSAAVINALLDLVFIPQYGYMAAAWATTISYGWLMFAHMFLVWRLGLSHVYDGRFNIFFAIVSSICIASCALLYNSVLARWTVLFFLVSIVLIVCWRKRQLLYSMLRR